MLQTIVLPQVVDAWSMTSWAERVRLRAWPDQVQLKFFQPAPVSDTACLWLKCVAEAVNTALVSHAHRYGVYLAPVQTETLNRYLQQFSFPEPTDPCMLTPPAVWALFLNTLEQAQPTPKAVSSSERDLIRDAIIAVSAYVNCIQNKAEADVLTQHIRRSKPLPYSALKSRFLPPGWMLDDYLGAETVLQLLRSARAEWLMRLSDPFRVVDLDEDTRCVEFMGLVRFISNRRSRIVSMQTADELGRWYDSGRSLDVYRPLRNPHWVGLYLNQWIENNRPGLPLEVSVELHVWLRRSLRREYKRLKLNAVLSQAAVRAFIEADFLDDDVRRLAMLGQTGQREHVLTKEIYNQTWQKIEFLQRIEHEAPTLLELYRLGIQHEVISACGGIEELKQVMRSYGVTQRGWQLLCQYGPEFYYGLKRTRAFSLNLQNIANHVVLFAQVDSQRCPPRQLQRALYLTNFLVVPHITQLPVQFIRQAWQALEQRQTEGNEVFFMKEEFLPVLWWIRSTKPSFDKNQRRAGWHFWLNAYDQWLQVQTQSEKPTHWQTASSLKPLEYGSYLALPLNKTSALIEEAEAMHNCLVDFDEDCANGIYLAFSIRERTTWRHIATLGLELNDGLWAIDQVLGYANKSVGHVLRRVALEICNRVNATVRQAS